MQHEPLKQLEIFWKEFNENHQAQYTQADFNQLCHVIEEALSILDKDNIKYFFVNRFTGFIDNIQSYTAKVVRVPIDVVPSASFLAAFWKSCMIYDHRDCLLFYIPLVWESCLSISRMPLSKSCCSLFTTIPYKLDI